VPPVPDGSFQQKQTKETKIVPASFSLFPSVNKRGEPPLLFRHLNHIAIRSQRLGGACGFEQSTIHSCILPVVVSRRLTLMWKDPMKRVTILNLSAQAIT